MQIKVIMPNQTIPSDLINGADLQVLDNLNKNILDAIVNKEAVETNEFIDKLTSAANGTIDAGDKTRQLVSGLIQIWMTASRRLAKVKSLVKSLRMSEVDDERSNKFGQLWSDYSGPVIETMRSYTDNINPNRIIAVNTLVKCNSTLIENDQVIQANLVELNLKKADGTRVSLDLSKQELNDLFDNLDKIQTELDSLLKP